MNDEKMKIAFEAAIFLEEQLTTDITGNHEFYFDPDVTDEGVPFVSITVDGSGVERLAKLFGNSIEFFNYHNGTTTVPIIIKPLISPDGMN